jgi:two-component sensor histidine kinase
LLVAALSLAPPFVALSFAQAYVERHKEREHRREQTILIARQATGEVETAIASALPLLEALRAQSQVGDAGEGCRAALRNTLRGASGYSDIIRVSAEDRLVCSALGLEDGDGLGGGEWIDELRAGAEFAVSDVFIGPISQRPLMLAGAPVAGREGGYNGAVAISIDLGAISDLTEAAYMPAGAVVALADRSGRVFSNAEGLGADRAPIEAIVRAVAMQGATWEHAAAELSGRDVVVAPLIGGTVLAIVPIDQLGWFDWGMADIGRIVFLPFLTWLLAITAMALATDGIVLRWVLYLSRAAQLYAGGRIDAGPERAQGPPAEFRELAVTMSDMADRVAEREAEREAEAHDALGSKMLLLKEIHHRVKNNLQIIISLLNIQIAASTEAATIAALVEARARINALAVVHRCLDEAGDQRLVRLKLFLGELITQIGAASGAIRHNVAIALEVEDLTLPPEAAVPLALFTAEAVTNAFKHAYKGRARGKLRIRVRREGGALVRLDIEDDGVGISGPEAENRGVGRSLMAAFARQLEGETNVGCSDLGGARTTLIFPAPADRSGT